MSVPTGGGAKVQKPRAIGKGGRPGTAGTGTADGAVETPMTTTADVRRRYEKLLAEGHEVTYRFMDASEAGFSIRFMASRLGASTSGFYEWRHRQAHP